MHFQHNYQTSQSSIVATCGHGDTTRRRFLFFAHAACNTSLMLFDSIMDSSSDRQDTKTKVLVMLAKVGYEKNKKKKIVSFTPFASGIRCGNGNVTPLSCAPVVTPQSQALCSLSRPRSPFVSLSLPFLLLSRSKTLPLYCCFS